MERDRHAFEQPILVHIDPFVHEGLVPFVGERVIHHVAVDRPHGDELVGTIAEGGVGCLHRADKRSHDEGALFPTIEHLHTFTYQLGWISAHRFDRITERQEVVNPGLGNGGGLGQGENCCAEGLDALLP